MDIKWTAIGTDLVSTEVDFRTSRFTEEVRFIRVVWCDKGGVYWGKADLAKTSPRRPDLLFSIVGDGVLDYINASILSFIEKIDFIL